MSLAAGAILVCIVRDLIESLEHGEHPFLIFDRKHEWEMPWMQREHLKANDGAPCHVPAVLPSPVVDGYRNKCEFSFGKGIDGLPALGFQLGQVIIALQCRGCSKLA